jgi:hypothetical protein
MRPFQGARNGIYESSEFNQSFHSGAWMPRRINDISHRNAVIEMREIVRACTGLIESE